MKRQLPELSELSRLLGLILLGGLLFVACQREGGEAEATATPTMTATAMATPTAVPTDPVPSATPAPTATATSPPVIPAITIADQMVGDDGLLTVEQVIAAESGWLVIQVVDGPVLGYWPVMAGEHEELNLEIDPFLAESDLEAILHIDHGEGGVFEYPGPDIPARDADEQSVVTAFNIELEITLPAIVVSDQTADSDGIIMLEEVVITERGWVAVHNDADGEPGQVVGFIPVEPGEWESLPVKLDWREATPDLHVVLYWDEGEDGRFEFPDGDPPVVIGEVVIETVFRATFPPDIFVLDQPAVEGTIYIERAVSYGPGWVVVYLDEDGAPGNIIGWAPLEDGVNELVEVELLNQGITSDLHLLLHEDSDVLGEFDFPRSDMAVTFEGRIPDPVTFRTDNGNYFIVEDQPLQDDTVTISLIVTDINSWVVIRATEEGEPAEIIGRRWLPPGVHRQVTVEVEATQEAEMLYVVLHLDGGTTEQFDFPGGLDIPLQRNRAIIQAPFMLLSDRP